MKQNYSDQRLIKMLRSLDKKQIDKASRSIYENYYALTVNQIEKRGIPPTIEVDNVFKKGILRFIVKIQSSNSPESLSLQKLLFRACNFIRFKAWHTYNSKQKKFYTDQQLIEMLRSRNKKQIDKATKMIEQYYGNYVFVQLKKRGFPPTIEVEDIFQNGIIYFIKKIQSGDINLRQASLQTLLLNACEFYRKNAWRTYNRQNDLKNGFTEQAKNGGSSTSEADNPLNQLIKKERKELIRQIISQMPKRCREVLTKRLIEDKAYKEIVEEMGLSTEASTRSLYSKCKKKLEKAIKNFLNKLEEKERKAKIALIISEMPKGYPEVLTKRICEKKSFMKIAEEMRLPSEAVAKSLFLEAIEELKKRMGSDFDEDDLLK